MLFYLPFWLRCWLCILRYDIIVVQFFRYLCSLASFLPPILVEVLAAHFAVTMWSSFRLRYFMFVGVILPPILVEELAVHFSVMI